MGVIQTNNCPCICSSVMVLKIASAFMCRARAAPFASWSFGRERFYSTTFGVGVRLAKGKCCYAALSFLSLRPKR